MKARVIAILAIACLFPRLDIANSQGAQKWVRRNTITSPEPIFTSAVSPVKSEVAAAHSRSISVWNMVSGQQEYSIGIDGLGPRDIINGLAYSPDGKQILAGVQSAQGQHKVHIVTLSDPKADTSAAVSAAPFAMSFAHSGKKLAVGLTNKEIKIFSFPELSELKTLSSEDYSASALAWSNDDTFLYAVGGGHGPTASTRSGRAPFKGELRVWNVDTGESMEGSPFPIDSANSAFNPVASVVASAGGITSIVTNAGGSSKKWSGDTIKAYKLPTKDNTKMTVLTEFKFVNYRFYSPNWQSMGWAPSGKMLAMADWNEGSERSNWIYLWDGNKMTTLSNTNSGYVQTDAFLVNNMWFSNTGKELAAVGAKYVRFWHAEE